ncbi:MAG: xanthine dehydrogenase family protein molybdopterin-binding subunit [Treponema sp.]|nr:xanthine dehydrogenase family protein molybdopterin-binding subunit [Treponema sp.]
MECLKDTVLFVDDSTLPNMFSGLTIRSPVAKGRLQGIVCPEMPPSYTLIKAEHIPGTNQLEDFPVPILASEELSYIGEPVALLVGPDAVKLEEYAAQCTVITDEAEGVFSSCSPAAGHIAERRIGEGDTNTIFDTAKTVVQGVYRTGIQEHWYAEPHGALAAFSDNRLPGMEKAPDKIVIYTATQWPFQVRRSVAGVLGLSPDMVVVEPSELGVHLDGKIWYPSLVSCHAALGTFITGKPVKVVLTREEDFRYSPKRIGTEIEIRSALGESGELLGTEITVRADAGAQGVLADEILDRICLGSIGAYTHATVKIEGFAARTNIPPQGALAGFGLSQGFFAMERQVSRIADTLRQDPATWRKQHRLYRNGSLAIGIPLNEPVYLEQVLDTATAMGDYYRKWAAYELLRGRRRETNWEIKDTPLRGIGIALAYQGSGFLYNTLDKGAYTVALTLEKDGSLEIRTSLVSTPGYTELWRTSAASILGVDPSLVRIHREHTDVVPDSGPAGASRNSVVITKLVEHACFAIRKQRFRDPLPITVQRSYRQVKKTNWEGKSMDQNALTHLSWGAAVVEVEMNTVTYIPTIRGVWLGIDGGRILSETRARKALKMGMIQALGWTSREQVFYEKGKIPDTFIYNYDIPTLLDIPSLEVDFIRNDQVNPKGIGELPFSTIPAAYLQAVSQAMDHAFETIPLLPAAIREAERLKKKEAEP